MKARIQFKTLADAVDHAKTNGGWIATLETGDVYWYSHHHTMSEVMMDFHGNGKVGTAHYFSGMAA